MKILYYVLCTISVILYVGLVSYVVVAYIKSGAFVSVFCHDMRRKDRHLPSADVAPVRHGRWKPGDMPTYGGFKCSLCKKNTIVYKPPYCPNCGAKMDGGET